MPSASDDPLLAHADELYGLPAGEFTAARDALAKELRSADRDLAAGVKALRRPSVAAWVVNLLVRRDAAQVDQVLQVGAALREAQRTLDGDELRALTRQRRQVTAAVTTQARALAAEEGARVTESVAEQVEATLTAAMVDEGAAEAVRSGLLVTSLSANGVDAADVAAAVALPDALGFEATAREAAPTPRPELHVVPSPEPDAAALRAARREAEKAVREASSTVRAATQAHRRAERALERLRAAGLQVQAELDELRRQVAEREARAEELDDQVGEAEEEVEDAAVALADAEAERDARQTELDDLD
ncbi:hypothetical protein [Nocardioides sp.]|uniref:hypothetical protein n=1 Tax=Nocardioides sp. TaxID=35761 RepID=UPI0035284753